MPRTIKLTTDGDFDLTGGTINFLEAGASIVQGCYLALQLFKDEWFLATNEGVDYFGDVFKKAPNLGALQIIFKNRLLGVEGVTAVVSLSLSIDSARRILSIRFRVDSDAGILDGSTTL